MRYSLTYQKICRTIEQANKERAILRMLQISPLRQLIPKPKNKSSIVVKMSYIPGNAASQDNLGGCCLDQLGMALSQLHRLRPGLNFGIFDENLRIQRQFSTFRDFLDAQIEKWIMWHNASAGSYLHYYAIWLQSGLEQLNGHFLDARPVFCHGDIDIKNLIVKEGKMIGLIDWEHAGIYCLAWELRKLPRVLRHDWQWQQLFDAYSIAMSSRYALMQAINYLDAVDLLGHLRWCITRRMQSEIVETLQKMHTYFNLKEVN